MFAYQVDISAEQPKPMVMHWAINDWNLSPESCRPAGTQQIDEKAVQTPFQDGKSIHLSFPEAQCPSRYIIFASHDLSSHPDTPSLLPIGG